MNRDFLKRLLETASPSGYERNAASLWKEEAKDFADSVYGDIHGNSIAKISSGNYSFPERIMLAGHIDEIGFIVSAIDDDGFVYFEPIGGFDPQIFPGQRVKVYSRNFSSNFIKGCIGRPPVHRLSDEEKKQVVKTENLWIDVGEKENAKKIWIGDYGVIDYSPESWGDILVARGLDDRIGAFAVLEALRTIEKEKLETAVYAVATVQEEIGLRGATTSTYDIKPKIGIAVDVTFASDYPGAKKHGAGIKMGGGPVIAIGPNITPAIHDALVETAKENNIPYQIEAMPRGTGTDANVIQLSRAGVATGLVSIPNRYMHSPCEMVDLRDVEHTIKLLARFCGKSIGQIFKSC